MMATVALGATPMKTIMADWVLRHRALELENLELEGHYGLRPLWNIDHATMATDKVSPDKAPMATSR